MKQLLFTLGFVLIIGLQLFAQPEIMNYQGVARDKAGLIIVNQEIALRISILEKSATGMPVFSEIHHVRTSQFGVFSLKIGTGEAVLANISNVDWAGSDHYIQVEMDATGGKNYKMMGTSQLLTVPYAFYAHSAGEIINGEKNELKVAGVPSQSWSLFGNSKTDPSKDKLGTTDETDLVFITNDIERLRIKSNGDISLKNSIDMGDNLTVKKNVFLNTESGETINNGPFTVSNGSPTFLTGSLTADGPTQLNSTLNVNNQSPTHLSGSLFVEDLTNCKSGLNVLDLSPTYLSGNLKVDGLATLNDVSLKNTYILGGLTVDGTTQFKTSLSVASSTYLRGGLFVLDNTNTVLTGDLKVEGSTILKKSLVTEGSLTTEGSVRFNNSLYATGPIEFKKPLISTSRVEINSDDLGNPSFDFPLRIKSNGHHGMAITVNPVPPWGEATMGNIFVDFWIPSGRVGSIKGENWDDRKNSPDFDKDIAFRVIDVFMESVNVTGGALELNPVSVFVGIFNGIKAIFNLTDGLKPSNLGVTYSSGSADYAEWLEKENQEERFLPGDIVGVKAGKISLNTQNADHYMLISRNPIVLGNMPEAGRESEYEKVAFLGQVPVKVIGKVNVGDYIIPSGSNKGFGIAVSPYKIGIGDIKKIVGVAWTGSDNALLSNINVAVGLNANDMVRHVMNLDKKIEEQAKVIEDLKARFSQVDKVLAKLDTNYGKSDQYLKTKSAQIIQDNAAEKDPSTTKIKITAEQIEEALTIVEKKLSESGIDVDSNPFLAKLKTDPEFKMNYISRIKKACDDGIKRDGSMNEN